MDKWRGHRSRWWHHVELLLILIFLLIRRLSGFLFTAEDFRVFRGEKNAFPAQGLRYSTIVTNNAPIAFHIDMLIIQHMLIFHPQGIDT